jgi:uncharacterized membrane protein
MAAGISLIQRALMGCLLLGFPLLAYYSVLLDSTDIGALLAILPISIIGLSLAWRSRQRGYLLALLGLSLVLLAVFWRLFQQNFAWLYLLEHVGAHLALCLIFGLSLRQGKQALCTRFAVITHGTLSPGTLRYTRQVTLAWTVYFASMAMVSTLLFGLAPLELWSAFANFLTPILMLLMFLVEYLIRLRVLPCMPHSSWMESLRFIWKSLPSLGRQA